MEQDVVRVAQVIGKMNNGGVESVVMNYYRNIDKTKIQFDFFVDEDSTNILRDEIERLGGRAFIIPPYQNIMKYIKELTSIFKNNKYQIVHAHINTLNVFPLFCAKVARIPIRISHSHSTSNKIEWKKNLVKNILKLFSKTFATDYFCCSRLAGEFQFGKKTFESGKVIVINNAIEINRFLYDEGKRKEVREKLGLDGKFVIGHVGRFIPQKNHERLIEIFHTFTCMNNIDTILLLIGEGELEPKIKERVKELNLEDKVIFLGPRKDVEELMQGMDMFLLPSLYEGLGMVLIEAQTAGLSSLASTEVPTCVNVANIVSFLDLNSSNEIWNEKILEIYKLRNKRKNTKKKIIEAGYDIKTERIKLENLYLEKIDDYNHKVLRRKK